MHSAAMLDGVAEPSFDFSAGTGALAFHGVHYWLATLNNELLIRRR